MKSGTTFAKVFKRLFYTRSDKHYPVERIRNIGISAHIDSGKTTLTERILFYAGRIDKIHEVKGRDGVGATMDSMELERQRGITIQSAATSVEWRSHNLNVIDTPGHVDFTVEVERALRVLDGAILVVCGVSGVQCQTLTVHRQIGRYSIPHLIFINKLDRPNSNVKRTMNDIRERLNKNVALMNIPIGRDANLNGVVDIINGTAVYFKGQYGEEVVEDEVPREYREKAKDMLDELIGCVAETDAEIAEMVLNDQRPDNDKLKASIRRGVLARQFIPVYVGSALKNKGVQNVLDGVVDYLPNPSERINNAIDNRKSQADGNDNDKQVYVTCKSDRDPTFPLLAFAFKLELGRFGQLTYLRVYQGVLNKNDLVFNVRTGKRTKVAKLFRMHADKMEEIESAFAGDICTITGAEASTGDTLTSDRSAMYSMEPLNVAEPVISMTFEPANKDQAESFSKAVNRFQKEDPTFKIKWDEETKQILALGMGELHLEIYAARIEREYGVPVKLANPKVAYLETIAEPFKFDYLHKKQSGGQGQYGRVIGIIEGFNESLVRGGLSGNRVSGIKIRLQDGDHHIVDSTEIAFILTAKGAMRQAFEEGHWHILEPWMNVEIAVPSEHLQQVTQQLGRMQALIRGQHSRNDIMVIECEAPLSQMFGFSTVLRSATKGKGEFTMEYCRCSPVRPDTAAQLIGEFENEKQKKMV